MLRFDGHHVKLRRANEHLNAAKVEVNTFLKRHPNVISPEINRKGQRLFEILLRYNMREPIPPSFGASFGDVIACVRASLDQLVWSLSIVHAISIVKPYAVPSLPGIEFPIFNDSSKFLAIDKKGMPNRRGGLYKIRFVHKDAMRIIIGLQPYHSGQKSFEHPLWILHELRNIDQHRRLNLVFEPLGDVGIRFPSHFRILSDETFGTWPLPDNAIFERYMVTASQDFRGEDVRVKHYVPF